MQERKDGLIIEHFGAKVMQNLGIDEGIPYTRVASARQDEFFNASLQRNYPKHEILPLSSRFSFAANVWCQSLSFKLKLEWYEVVWQTRVQSP